MEKKLEEIKNFVINRYKKGDGWLTKREGPLLYNLARKCKKGTAIVEVGSFKGKSTIYLAGGSKNGSRNTVYAIDPHTGLSVCQPGEHMWTFEEFKNNIRDIEMNDIVVPILKVSAEACKDFDQPISLIFIDGEHTFEAAKKDFECWYPKICEGGTMAFHDTIVTPGPKLFVKDYIFKSTCFKRAKFTDSITYAVKTSQNSFFDRLHNKYTLWLKDQLEYWRRRIYLHPVFKHFFKKVLDFIQ